MYFEAIIYCIYMYSHSIIYTCMPWLNKVKLPCNTLSMTSPGSWSMEITEHFGLLDENCFVTLMKPKFPPWIALVSTFLGIIWASSMFSYRTASTLIGFEFDGWCESKCAKSATYIHQVNKSMHSEHCIVYADLLFVWDTVCKNNKAVYKIHNCLCLIHSGYSSWRRGFLQY